jgi:hypothetical protein
MKMSCVAATIDIAPANALGNDMCTGATHLNLKFSHHFPWPS